MRTTPFRFLALLLIIVACATGSQYPAASNDESERSVAYDRAGDKIESLRAIGRVTDAQWGRYKAAEAQVRQYAPLVDQSLAEWSLTGKKPPEYDGTAMWLHEAQDKVIALSLEVSL